MTLTKLAMTHLNRQRLLPAERNEVIRRASQLAQASGCLSVVPVWYVRNALEQLDVDKQCEVVR